MRSIKIGTRNSPLALWQAEEVAKELQNRNYSTEIIPIVASGDKNLSAPLYAMGITGVFTKDLDVALLNKEIDVAVHSLKDVPTLLPENIENTAYLKRDFQQDVLVRRKGTENMPLHEMKIATSSLRRRAFWLKEYPETQFSDIRGNVNTRLKKLEEGIADATLFSLAGIKRLNLDIAYEELPFMLCAPSQGVVVASVCVGNEEVSSALKEINDVETQICVEIERSFLNTLEGGCTAPIGAFAEINAEKVRFLGRLCSLDGKNCIETDEIFTYKEGVNYGEKFALEVMKNGGREIMDEIKINLKL